MAGVRVAIESGQDVARRRATQSQERRQGHPSREREQDDAADAEGPGRELPDAQPRGRQEKNGDREPEDKRRPHALDQKSASRQSCERREPPADD